MENNNDNIETCATQNQRIAAYLMAGNSITQMEALHLFQCFRLASRISDLRKAGLDIAVKKILTPTGKRVAQYTINTL